MTQELLSEKSGSAFARAVIRHETILLFVFDELGEARIEDADLKKACGYALPGRFSRAPTRTPSETSRAQASSSAQVVAARSRSLPARALSEPHAGRVVTGRVRSVLSSGRAKAGEGDLSDANLYGADLSTTTPSAPLAPEPSRRRRRARKPKAVTLTAWTARDRANALASDARGEAAAFRRGLGALLARGERARGEGRANPMSLRDKCAGCGKRYRKGGARRNGQHTSQRARRGARVCSRDHD